MVRQYAPNVSFALVLTSGGYGPNAIQAWYPGDAYVDWMGSDGYNTFGCRGTGGPVWQDFSSIFGDFYNFAVAHNKPAVIAEWGSTEDPATPGRKAAWITAAGQTMETWPQLKAASYFDAPGQDLRCFWPLTSSPSATAAFAGLGSQSWFNPRPVAALSANPPIGPAPLTVAFDTTGTAGTMNSLASWEVDYGDGSNDSGSGAPPTSLSHTYGAGDHTATLVVTDTAGESNVISVTVQATPPSVGNETAKVTSNTSAILNGSADGNGLNTTIAFQWGTTPALGQSTSVDIGAGTRPVNESTGITGLAPGTTYDWRVAATSAAGTTNGPLQSFTTQGGLPGVTNASATLTSPTSAVLSGSVDPKGVDTQWSIEYGPTTSYGSTLPVNPGDAGSGTAAVPVSVTVTGLSVSSSYHFAIVATNAVGTTVSFDRSFGTSKPPSVGSESVPQGTPTSAKLTAAVNPVGLPTTVDFQWGTTPALGQSTTSVDGGTGSKPADVSTSLSGLAPGTTYYWNVVATNDAGTTNGPVTSFKTQGNAPAITNASATLKSPTSAVLSGSVDPKGVDTQWYVEYGPTTSYGSTLPVNPGDAGSGTAAVPVSVTVTGLSVSSTYHFAIVATNAVGTTVSPDRSFGTSKPPSVGSESVPQGTPTSAKLTAAVNPVGLPTTVDFQWGTTPALGHSTRVDGGAGSKPADVSTSLTGLAPGTTYYWNVAATNDAGTTNGPVKSFKTQGNEPAVTNAGATLTSPTSAVLSGSVDPKGVDTQWYVEYGPTTSYGSTLPVNPGDAGSGTAAVPVSVTVTGLSVSSTYHFAIVATNAVGTTVSPDRSFGTSKPPSVGSESVPQGTPTSAKLTAAVNPVGLPTTVDFQWGTTPALGHSTRVDGGAGSKPADVSTSLTGLAPGTTYYWNVAATNDAGTTNGPVKSFKTQGNEPAVTNAGATLTSPTSAVLSGSVDPKGVDTQWYVEYGPTTSYGSTLPVNPGDAGSGTAAVPVSVTVTGLSVSSTYHFAIVATNAVGTTVGRDHAFRTSNPPRVGSETVSRPSPTSAELSAAVNPRGLPTTYQFHWGTSPATDQVTDAQSAGSDTTPQSEKTLLSGLQTGTVYYWYVTATNDAGTTTGPVKSFTAH